jgi:type II secretory pathway pseudopilin PulG
VTDRSSILSRRAGDARHRGFTLIEAALTTIIVGVGVVASMALFGACSTQNINATQMTTAMLLASNIQEAMANVAFCDPIMGKTTFGPEGGESLATYDDVDDFDGLSINPPIDALRSGIPQMSQFSQVVSVVPVSPNNLTSVLPKTVVNRAVVRVQVRVLYQRTPDAGAQEVYRTDWIRSER